MLPWERSPILAQVGVGRQGLGEIRAPYPPSGAVEAPGVSPEGGVGSGR